MLQCFQESEVSRVDRIPLDDEALINIGKGVVDARELGSSDLPRRKHRAAWKHVGCYDRLCRRAEGSG